MRILFGGGWGTLLSPALTTHGARRPGLHRGSLEGDRDVQPKSKTIYSFL